jgi:hypothetical protein
LIDQRGAARTEVGHLFQHQCRSGELSCRQDNADARRRFFEFLKTLPNGQRNGAAAAAHEAVQRIDALYLIEGQIKDLSEEERTRIRKAKAIPAADLAARLGKPGAPAMAERVTDRIGFWCMNECRSVDADAPKPEPRIALLENGARPLL